MTDLRKVAQSALGMNRWIGAEEGQAIIAALDRVARFEDLLAIIDGWHSGVVTEAATELDEYAATQPVTREAGGAG